MAKSSSRYVCNACGSVHAKWAGQCDGCGAWDTLNEEHVESTPKGLKAGKGK
ncbi:MAG: DNA repair protein RadA, partial [Rickettsiales bacterium]|nr:DNA repair protein RadA [Rickettsiales bacterium]